MRRGHTFIALAASFAATACFTGVPAALADDGTPGDICQQVQSGQISPSDPIVQGYCGPIVLVLPPPVTVTPPAGAASPPAVSPQPATPLSPPSATPAAPAAVVAAVQGARHTIAAPSSTQTHAASVKGAQHTVRAPISPASAGPLAATKATGTLPFTGAQLGIFAVVGLALVATGLVLRSTGRPAKRR